MLNIVEELIAAGLRSALPPQTDVALGATPPLEGARDVRIVVIPDVRNRRPFDPFRPKTPPNLIADIEAYLAGRAPPTARVTVINPAYIEVKIRVGVRFRDTGNDDFYRARLIDELNRFLAPWAYDEGADIAIGRRIYANSIVSFIDTRSYVEFVGGITLFCGEDSQRFRPIDRPPPGEAYYVETDRPEGILVTAREHQIDIIPEEIYEPHLFIGIGYMKIDFDFIVG